MTNALGKVACFVVPVFLAACALLCPGAQSAGQTRRPSLPGLTDSVNSIQFSPDSRTLAMAWGARGPGRIELWDVETGKLKRVIKGFDGAVWSVSFSADGKTIITGSGGSYGETLAARRSRRFTELKWWDVETGDLKQRIEMTGDDRLTVAAFHSPDGSSLATLEYSSTTSTLVPGFDSAFGDRLPGFPLSFRTYVTYRADLRLRDARTGDVLLKLRGGLPSYERPFYGDERMPEPMTSAWRYQRLPVVFSPDGKIVANWNQSELRLWNGSTGEEVRKLKDFKGRLSAAAFSPDSRSLAAGITRVSIKKDQRLFKSQVLIYDIATGQMTKTLAVATDAISSIAFSLNGTQLLIGGWRADEDRNTGTVELVNMERGSLGSVHVDEDGEVQSFVLSPNARTMALQIGPSTVKLLDTLTWSVKHAFDGLGDTELASAAARSHILSVKSVPVIAFSSDGKTVTGGIEQDGVRVWDVRTGEVKKELAENEQASQIMAISASGRMVGEVREDQTLLLWNAALGESMTFPTSGGPVSAFALSPDGSVLATGQPNRIALRKTSTGDPLQTLQSQHVRIESLVFSTDGRNLATGEGDRIEIWDLETGQVTRTITSGCGLTALRFAPGNRILAMGCEDGSVSLWDLQTGVISSRLKKHSGAVNAIAFSLAGDLMATGGDDRTVIIWETAAGKARRKLKGHDMTVTSVAFSPDASLLAAGSGNASVVLWEVRTGELNRVLR